MAQKPKAKVQPAKVTQPQHNRSTTKRKRSDDTEPVPSRPKKVIKQETKDCDICAETKPMYRDFPKLPACDHDPTVCKDCYQKHFKIRIEENRDLGWNACNCPVCGHNVTKDDAQGILPRPISREFDKMITKMTQQSAHNFLWCPASGCGHGQSYKLTKAPWVKCSKCKSKICFNHQRLWHEGLTCADFDNMANKHQAAQKDHELIRTTTKACPYCKRRIKKEGGCNHMICIGCRKQWIWNEVPFDGETIATQAETLGKRGGAPPITGELRQNVGRIIAASNAQIDADNARQAGTTGFAPIIRQTQRWWVDWVAQPAPDMLPPPLRRQVSPLPVLQRAAENQTPQSNQSTPREGRLSFHRRALNNFATTITAGITNLFRASGADIIDLTTDDNVTIEQMAETARQVALDPQESGPGARTMQRNGHGRAENFTGFNRNNPIDLTSED